MSQIEGERQRVLRSLLELDGPLGEVLYVLAALPWDCDEEVVTLLPRHVVRTLERFSIGSLSAGEVERWADSIEGRDDIGLDAECRDTLKEVVFFLANPVLEGVLTNEGARRWIERLAKDCAPSAG
ncbi:hypothetical protein [Vulgatibacter incomptus]|uniref:hypothetical protein n=1 Tax=Vulgatibacter incomptus TaxID=1391653 RepID=UPI000680A77C|nr:hypothetical protein [Vulgatibacter incomptus]